jgi:hypothetical protein
MSIHSASRARGESLKSLRTSPDLAKVRYEEYFGGFRRIERFAGAPDAFELQVRTPDHGTWILLRPSRINSESTVEATGCLNDHSKKVNLTLSSKTISSDVIIQEEEFLSHA